MLAQFCRFLCNFGEPPFLRKTHELGKILHKSSCVSACAISRIAQEWGTLDISFLAQVCAFGHGGTWLANVTTFGKSLLRIEINFIRSILRYITNSGFSSSSFNV